MKVLLLCWRDTTHPQGGGSERYLERVAEHLVRQGHEVVYRTASYTDAPRRSMREGVRYSRSGGKLTVYPKAALAMLAGRLHLGTLAGVDVVVDTQNGIPFFARWFSGRPTVLLTHHCHREQWPVAGPFLARLGWWLESKVSPRAYRGAPYVTVSEPSKQELVRLGVRDKDITIIRNGVDAPPTYVPRLADDGLTHLVTLSRLVPHKQIEHAIDVVRDLDGVVLDIIGSGWWEDRLREYAAEVGATKKIVFHGQVAEDHKHALLEVAALHLMPSRKEGWGLAVIEAAQHGVPTIGYRSSGGLNDSVRDGETGLLVDSPEEMREKVVALLADAKARQRLGSAAKLRAAEFSWEDTGARFEELLQRLARR
ncbi:glycosyltransferase family 4 protein [Corynebacterium vitaeruminis]|uniref:glycosyltransferase family 4 protein n=1 Tax=Corynebacterium vitaeruminis TaxID=38305 RepID=UPI0023F56D07|nr:glycosyltransferase family 4 protein [Corynebacterium vitaeruminis]